jgi:hypothetical protein
MEPKYNEGDEVRVCRNIAATEADGFVSIMKPYQGQKVLIKSKFFLDGIWRYFLDGVLCTWKEFWLEPLEAVVQQPANQNAPQTETNSEPAEIQPENFVRSAPGIITSDEELLIVFQIFLANLKEATRKGKVVAFLPENIILPDEKIDGENFLFEPKEIDVELPEALRLLGAILYHLVAGKSEFTHESFILDGYRRPLNSSLWPLIVALLKGEVKSIEEVEGMLNSINPEEAVQNIQPVPLTAPATSSKTKMANDLIRELAGQQIKILDHEKVSNFWNVVVPQNVEIHYDEQTLRESIEANRNGEQWALAYCTGQSIRQIRQKIGTSNQPCFCDNDWWLEDDEDYWADKTLEPGYYLLNFNGKFRDENWDTQGRHIAELGPMFERCHEFLVSEAVFSNFNIHNGERILKNWYHWGQELDSVGYRVVVGDFDSGGFGVGGRSPGGSHDRLRVVVARKFDA